MTAVLPVCQCAHAHALCTTTCHEYVTFPLNAMRCPVCGHRLDDMDGCDSCAADLEASGWSDDPDDGGRR